VRAGFSSLDPADEDEEDMLDRAWGVEQHSRLACQVLLPDTDLTIEIPRYSRNLSREKVTGRESGPHRDTCRGELRKA
jgi:2Fe-2S ferredoxin